MKTKIRLRIPATIIALSAVFMVTNCTKDDVIKDATLPVLTTTEVIAVTQTTATSGGVITSDGGFTVTERGVCWSTSQSPTFADNKTTDGTGAGSFTSAITGLTANTTYYVRAYATNSKGTGYGSVMSFTTPENSGGTIVFNPNITYGSMTDIDGNTYKTVTIGTQTWMAENLKVTKYNDGAAIPKVTDATAWSELTTGALCDYENTPSNSETYGKLYNWHAVNTGKLCPTGWHVPSDAEWTELTDYLGETDAGGKLKETGTTHWNSPNTSATNETGFTALPGGARSSDYGVFTNIGYHGYWWSATEIYATTAWSRTMSDNYNYVYRFYSNKEIGFSVRCVRD
jgi:uncharacterized protein (TIGR02145 family)